MLNLRNWYTITTAVETLSFVVAFRWHYVDKSVAILHYIFPHTCFTQFFLIEHTNKLEISLFYTQRKSSFVLYLRPLWFQIIYFENYVLCECILWLNLMLMTAFSGLREQTFRFYHYWFNYNLLNQQIVVCYGLFIVYD